MNRSDVVNKHNLGSQYWWCYCRSNYFCGKSVCMFVHLFLNILCLCLSVVFISQFPGFNHRLYPNCYRTHWLPPYSGDAWILRNPHRESELFSTNRFCLHFCFLYLWTCFVCFQKAAIIQVSLSAISQFWLIIPATLETVQLWFSAWSLQTFYWYHWTGHVLYASPSIINCSSGKIWK